MIIKISHLSLLSKTMNSINKIRFKKFDPNNNNNSISSASGSQFIDIYNNKESSLIENSNSIKLDDGNEILSIPIGRSTEGLNLKDNLYISNNQVDINILNKQTINIVAKGINPTFLKKLNDTNTNNSVKKVLGNQLDTNISYDLSNGDILSFLSPNNQSVSLQFDIETLKLDDDKEEKEEKVVVAAEVKTNKRKSIDDDDKTITTETTTNNTTTTTTKKQPSQPPQQPTKMPAKFGWADLLLPYCYTPENYKKDVVVFDNEVVMINDKYPKSKYHFLIMPRKVVNDFTKLTKQDIPLLEHMYKTAAQHIESKKLTTNNQFKFGFHAIPSMKQLHLHCISIDFQSDSLKKKEHWHSFTTDFFIPFSDFIDMLSTKNSITIDKEYFKKLKESPLTCPQCKIEKKTIPLIKSHYFECINK